MLQQRLRAPGAGAAAQPWRTPAPAAKPCGGATVSALRRRRALSAAATGLSPPLSLSPLLLLTPSFLHAAAPTRQQARPVLCRGKRQRQRLSRKGGGGAGGDDGEAPPALPVERRIVIVSDYSGGDDDYDDDALDGGGRMEARVPSAPPTADASSKGARAPRHCPRARRQRRLQRSRAAAPWTQQPSDWRQERGLQGGRGEHGAIAPR